MIDVLLVGAIGGIIIILSWAYETWETVKRHKSLIDLKFAAVNVVGVSMLIAYSLWIDNMLFFYLNSVLLMIELFEIGYSLSVKKVHKRKNRERH